MEVALSKIYQARSLSVPEPFQLRKWKASNLSQCSYSVSFPRGFSHPSIVQTRYDFTRNNFTFKILSSQKEHVHVLERSRMEEVYDTLTERLLPTAAEASSTYTKRIIGLAGPPGAGKSTLANEVVNRVNKLWPEKASSFDSQVEPPNVAIVLPMDGFHLYRSELDAMKRKPMQEGEVVNILQSQNNARLLNTETILTLIGFTAPWTFNPVRLLACLNNLRSRGSVYVPSFDHGVGDPVEDDIFVNIQHKVVIVEGNYLLLEDDVWSEVSSKFDETWFIDVDIDTAMQRVLKRHISTGKSPDIAKWRIEYNDRPNAELIMKTKKNANLIIKSVDL